MTHIRAVLNAPYIPRPLAAWIGPALSGILAFTATVRGIDLLTGPPPAGRTQEVVNLLGPEFWGYAVLASGACLILGLSTRKLVILIFAHCFAAAVYFGYSLATLQGVAAAGTGWRFFTALFAPALIHGVRTWSLLADLRVVGAEVNGRDRRRADLSGGRVGSGGAAGLRRSDVEGGSRVQEGPRQRPTSL